MLAKTAKGLDLVVDYGIFTVLAAPLFWLLKWLHGIIGNWGWAIVVMTIMIKAAFYPLNAAAARSMAKMKIVAPKMKALQEQYANDKQQLQIKMMEMYKTGEDQSARRLPADPGADPGVHRAVLGAAVGGRAAPGAVDPAGSTTCRRPIRTSCCR